MRNSATAHLTLKILYFVVVFRLITPTVMSGPPLLNSNCACLKGNLYLFGGTAVTEGPDFGYIWCSFDLQVEARSLVPQKIVFRKP
jgi:hypothetical protein